MQITKQKILWTIDELHRDRGTRFSLYAQPPWIPGFETPITAWLSPDRGKVRTGPRDRRIKTCDAIKPGFKKDETPVYNGPVNPAVPPGPDGHFDHIEPIDDTFLATHAYGCVRRTLDIWEYYCGHNLSWPMTGSKPLTVYPRVSWNNAQFGPGFIELGSKKDKAGNDRPYALNFDVIAHETGHAIAFKLGGLPTTSKVMAEFVGFHEAMADTISILSSMHFPRVLWHTLETCQGDIYAENVINRIGELSKDGEIRMMSSHEVHSDERWQGKLASDVKSKELHDISLPLSGAMMDMMVFFYLSALARLGVIEKDKSGLGKYTGIKLADRAAFKAIIVPKYKEEPELFRIALAEARDRLAKLTIGLLKRINANDVTLHNAGRTIKRMATRPEYADAKAEINDILKERGFLD